MNGDHVIMSYSGVLIIYMRGEENQITEPTIQSVNF
jgi:hypothetical protein